MAKVDKGLYRSLRKRGVRKSFAQAVAEASGRADKGSKKGTKALQGAVKDLRSVVADLEDRAKGGPAKRRKAAAQKGSRTRKRKAAQRRASARKGAQKRAKSR